ncbi:unnamed protein product [Agarophyton chilense]
MGAPRRTSLPRPPPILPVTGRKRIRNVRTPHALHIQPSSPNRHQPASSTSDARSTALPPSSNPFRSTTSPTCHRSHIHPRSTPKSVMLSPSQSTPLAVVQPPATKSLHIPPSECLPPLRPHPAFVLPPDLPSANSEPLHASIPSSPNPSSQNPPSSPTPTPPLSRTLPRAHAQSVSAPVPFSLRPSPTSPPPPEPSNHPSSATSKQPVDPATASRCTTPETMRRKLRFRPGDLVLCRYYNYPVWPAVVAATHQPASKGRYFTMRPTRSGDDAVMAYWVTFAGETVGGWIRCDCIVPYHPSYAAQIEVHSQISIYKERRQALKVAELEYKKTPSRFGYTDEDMLRIAQLREIPINEYVDMKSQDTDADGDSDLLDSNEQTSGVDISSENTDVGDEIYPVQSPAPRHSKHMSLRPRKVKIEIQSLSRRVLRPRASKTSTFQNETFTQDDDQHEFSDDDAVCTFVKCEPREINVPATQNATAPTAEKRPMVKKDTAHPALTPLPSTLSKKEPQPSSITVARRKRGRPRRHPVSGQKQPVSSRITKPEPAVNTQAVVKGEPEDALTHIPAQPSYRRQFRRKRRGRPRKVVSPPEPTLTEVRETSAQVIDRMQRRISRQEKQIVHLSQQQKYLEPGPGSSVGRGTLPSITLLSKAPDPKAIRAQTEKFVRKLLNFQRLSVELAVEAERFQEAKTNCEEAWKAVVQEGRGTEQQAMELEEFLAKLPNLAQFLRSVRM